MELTWFVTMKHDKWRSHLGLGKWHSGIILIFTTLISTSNVNQLLAQPPCYLMDANGNTISLRICTKPTQAAVTPPKTATPLNSNPTNPTNSNPNLNNQGTPSSNNGNNNTNNSIVTNGFGNMNQTAETNTPRFVPKINRRMPLLQ